jgi:hypothetical protein
MSVWVLVFLVAAVKIPIAALMLWLPFRSDRARLADEGVDDSSENGGDGGIKAAPERPREPHPRSPLGRPRRRGPHGTPASPERVRTPGVQRQRATR